MRMKFKNARILSLAKDTSIFEGELWVKDNKIEYIGPKKESMDIFDRTIDAQGNVLMPGFKNAHTHSPMTFLRSYADDLPLNEWLYKAVFPLEALLEPGDEYALAKVAFAEYLTSGITADFDMYYNPMEVVKASIDSGFRTVCLGTVTRYKESVAEMVDSFHKINGMHELVSYRLGFHAEYTSTPEILAELSKAANELKTPIFTHTSETEAEVQGCIDRHGMTPVVYFESLGLLNYGGGGFHCVHLTEQDLDIYQKRGLYAVTCPSSNTKLASGIAPIQTMLDRGINLAIGTDGPASGNCLDFFREMFLVTGLGKLKTKNAAAVEALEVLKMATVGGAKAMGLNDADVLAEGKLADIIMIDLHQPNMQPINKIAKNIVYSGSKSNIKMTMINGKILFENGQFFLDQPIEEIYAKAQAITDRIKQKALQNK